MFKEYYNPLCNFAISYVNDRKLAQDVVQDVFTNLWSKRNVLKVSDEKNYLFQAVKNRSLEVIRKAKHESKIAEEEYVNTFTSNDNLDAEAKKYLLKEKLYNSIRQLPPKCQEIFVLNKLNGLTYSEVAEELNISVKTVENQIGKGYRKLRGLMADFITEI